MSELHEKKLLLILGGLVIALSIVLFTAGVMRGSGPGVLVIAFIMMTALSAGLLAVIFRAPNVPVRPVRSGEKRSKAKAAERPEAADERGGPGTGLISETAGELRSSVEVIQEELEEILEDEIPTDKKHIESLYNETDRIRKIIDGMEQLSRAQALARSLKKVPVQVEPLLNKVIERSRNSLHGKEISFSLQCEPGLTVAADSDCLDWITGNLIDNAANAVSNSGSVIISAGRSGDSLVFSVTDTGTGIRRSHVPHLFERFFRGSGSGIGMGLAIVKELVDACGGRIEVETGAGKGSTFTVRVPSA